MAKKEEFVVPIHHRPIDKISSPTGLFKNCQVCRHMKLRPESKKAVMVRSNLSGLVAFGRYERFFYNFQVDMARSVAGDISRRPF